MSWYELSKRMHQNPINGFNEFNNGNPIDGNPHISKTYCDYCEKEVLCVWDDYNKNQYWPYLGNQARKPNTYKYSDIIQKMRNHFNVVGKVWDEEHGNNLMNLHARCHSTPNDWSKRAHPNSLRILCSSCFQKTYKRIKVLGDNGIEYQLTVLPERGETIESVMKELNIKGKIL